MFPAIIKANGTKFWCKNRRCHREDKDESGYTLPAVIKANGTEKWYKKQPTS